LQSLLCIFGVALGVAVIIAIDLANQSASRAFTLSTETVAGKATHQIIGGASGLDQEVYRKVRVDLGIRESAPVIDGYANALELDRQPLRILGVDIFAEAPFRSFLGTGGGGGQVIGGADFSVFLTQPDTILIGEETARRYNLNTGSTMTLRVGDKRAQVRVIGLLRPADNNSRRALDGIGIMDIGAAQALFGMAGKISHIDLIADERTPQGAERLDRIRAILPPAAQIVRPENRGQSVESLSDAFELNLTALSLLALVVGMFLIYNTITFSVVQRRPIFGTLRCLGVTQREVFGTVIIESLLLGAIGGLIGVGLGVVLGRGAVQLVTRTINDLYYVVNVRDVDVNTLTLAKGFLIGLVAALLAALPPAYEATNIQPITALRRSFVEQTVRKILPPLSAVGGSLIGVGVLLLYSTANLVVNFAGIFAVVIGSAFVAPLLTLWLMNAIHPIFSVLGGVIGRMATRGIINSLSRTAIAIASLMIAVSVIIGLQSMIGSFRQTLITWLNGTIVADVYISIPSRNASESVAMDPETSRQIQLDPSVADVSTIRNVKVDFVVGMPGDANMPSAPSSNVQWRAGNLQAIATTRIRQPAEFVWAEADNSVIWQNMGKGDVVQVSEPFANKFGITPQNNVLWLRTDQGARTFKVIGVYYDYATDQGSITIHRKVYDRYWNDNNISAMALYVKPNVDVRETVDRMRKQLADKNWVVNANRELRNNALVVFDRTFAITNALNLLAMLVAFIGVLSALMALQIERTREYGTLRANGLTLRQLWRMTLLETGLMGGTAGLFAMPTGLVLAIILVYVINLRSFGWTIRLVLDWQTFAQALAVAVLSALLACLYPMFRLGKLQIATAVRQE
jgi:putative ABC transport system permease protein